MRLFLFAIALGIGSFEIVRFGGPEWVANLLVVAAIATLVITVVAPGTTFKLVLDREVAFLLIGFALAVASFLHRPTEDARWYGNIAFWVTACAVAAAIVHDGREPEDAA